MKISHSFILAAIVLSVTACKKQPDLEKGLYAQFNTTKGDFIAELYFKKAPMTTANFVALAEGNHPLVKEKYKGEKFFDSLTFHRVVEGFVIQGGDPEGTGRGGPGYKFPDEFSKKLDYSEAGVLAMANSGPDTNGSQFFITLAPKPSLDQTYSIFGQIVKGMKVVDSIGQVKTNRRSKPLKPVVMKTVDIIRVGAKAEDFKAPKVFKRELKAAKKAKKQAQVEKNAAQKKRAQKIAKQMSGSLAKTFKKTESGLRYKILEKNEDGKSPKPGQVVAVHYTGMLPSGKIFDSSRKRGKPITFKVGTGRVIPGWDEGIMLLKTGEKARLIIPPELAYGKKGAGPIPPNSTLIFDVELMRVGPK